MTDLLLDSLQKVKKYEDFDINYALICAELCHQVYLEDNSIKDFLLKYNFVDGTIISKSNATAIAACYAGDLYISIKGTDFSDKNDVMDDADTQWSKESNGYVHSGYKRHIDLIWTEIEQYINLHKDKKIIITGHSLGGACGQILNVRLQNSIGYYFGSPRVVDKIIKKENKSLIYQLENKYDIVPGLPPKFLGFNSMGRFFSLRSGIVLEKENKWYNEFYSFLYTVGYLLIVAYTKIFGGEKRLSDLILISHEIVDYISNIENIINNN